MTDEPTKDAEAIAALDALKPETQYIGLASMRRALDAAAAHRKAISDAMPWPDTYPIPADGWTCFHCGEKFTTPGSARDHFGCEPCADPACRIKVGEERGLVMALRKVEAELERYRNEDKKATERDEVTDHDDLQAAECIRYQQSSEKD